MLNLDMIGRLRHDRLYVEGLRSIPNVREFEDELQDYADLETLSLSFGYRGDGTSDHASFTRAGIPSLFFFTGLHGDYHKPSDDAQFINVQGMTRVLRVSYLTSDYLLRLDQAPLVANSGGGRQYATWSRESPYFGVSVDRQFLGEGLRLAEVTNDGPAHKAGLQPGDVLIELNGLTVASVGKATAIIEAHRPGDTVSAKVRRKNRIVEVKVQLSRWP